MIKKENGVYQIDMATGLVLLLIGSFTILARTFSNF